MLLMALAIVAVFLLIAFASAANCILVGRTCPPPGSVREMLEDTLMAAIGFAGGRYSAGK